MSEVQRHTESTLEAENERLRAENAMYRKVQDALSDAAEALGRDRGTRSDSVADRIRAIRSERDALKKGMLKVGFHAKAQGLDDLEGFARAALERTAFWGGTL